MLEVGCGPGGISFALSRVFEEVKGVDLSESFILKCKAVKETGEITYQIPVEGDILREVTYKVPEDVVSQLNRYLILFDLYIEACHALSILTAPPSSISSIM